ncbi:MAG: quinol:cytochrome c oxidoreductase pentaheme cytochrome subunit [Phycisphaerales bacterium]|nr:quinol:cytochrome c oxidoreductase pentaheme cytochrome subunit [Phycisphaerales bacterium]
MPQLFHPATNTIARVSIFGTIFLTAGLGWMAWGYERSSYITRQGDVRPQPVPFSHEHHVRGLGIDCRYCHTSVEDSYFAGLPATKVCMTCHSQMWTNAPLLQPVRDSWVNNRPISWTRVHNLPGFVYFNHSIHVNKGVGCVSCHGEVDGMPLMWKASSLQMEWCLECHREPERVLRPRDEVFNLHYDPARDPKHPGETQLTLGRKLKEQYHLLSREQLQNCSTCHR